MAEGQKQAAILKAEGEAQAILAVERAKAEGIKMVYNAIKEADPTKEVVAIRSLEALEKVSAGQATKIVVPTEAANILGALSGIKGILEGEKAGSSGGLGGGVGASPQSPPAWPGRLSAQSAATWKQNVKEGRRETGGPCSSAGPSSVNNAVHKVLAAGANRMLQWAKTPTGDAFMPIHTKLCDMLDIEYPVIQGGMAWVATAELAAAVSEAGGLGIIGAGSAAPDVVRAEVRKARSMTSKPFGVNVYFLSPFAEQVIQTLIEEKVPVVTTGAGNPGKYVPAMKDAGMKILAVVASVNLAKRLRGQSGCPGRRGHGVRGQIGGSPRCRSCPDCGRVNIPVVAAGRVVLRTRPGCRAVPRGRRCADGPPGSSAPRSAGPSRVQAGDFRRPNGYRRYRRKHGHSWSGLDTIWPWRSTRPRRRAQASRIWRKWCWQARPLWDATSRTFRHGRTHRCHGAEGRDVRRDHQDMSPALRKFLVNEGAASMGLAAMFVLFRECTIVSETIVSETIPVRRDHQERNHRERNHVSARQYIKGACAAWIGGWSDSRDKDSSRRRLRR